MPEYGWIIRDGREVYCRLDQGPEPKRSILPCPQVISDEMPPGEHVDGRIYTSKSAFRRVTKAEGYIEIGTEKLKPMQKKRPDRKEIRAALERAKARVFA